MPDMEEFSRLAREAEEVQEVLDAQGEEEDQVDGQRFDADRWARGPWNPDNSSDDNSDSEFGWGDCDGNHPDGEHCEICASSSDCHCHECYANAEYDGDETYDDYYRMFYWYYYFFYMGYWGGYYAERAVRGSQFRHDQDGCL